MFRLKGFERISPEGDAAYVTARPQQKEVLIYAVYRRKESNTEKIIVRDLTEKKAVDQYFKNIVEKDKA